MPLLKGKENMQKNIEMLIKEGKPPKQAVAIAYSKVKDKDDKEENKKHEKSEVINIALNRAKNR